MRIVIIGAGVLGASTAFHLARAGARGSPLSMRTWTGERPPPVPASSARGFPACEDQVFYRLYAAGGEYYPDLIAATGGRRGKPKTRLPAGRGHAGVPRSAGTRLDRALRSRQRDAPAMGNIARLSARAGAGVVSTAAAGARRRPFDRRRSGRRPASGGALLRAAGYLAATVLQGPCGVGCRGGTGCVGAWIVGGERDRPADRVIVTAGAWVDRCCGRSASPAGRTAARPDRASAPRGRRETKDWPVILPPGSHYIVPFDGGRIVAGATRESGAGFDYRVTAAGQAEVLSEALRIAPGLGAATMIETRVGFRPAGAEVRPLLGWVRGDRGTGGRQRPRRGRTDDRTVRRAVAGGSGAG